MNIRRMIRALTLAVLGSAFVYALIVFASGGGAVLATVRGLPLSAVLLVVAMSTSAYILRGVRWGWLMRRAGYPVRTGDALYLHLSGQTMGITPGRVGEVLKPYLAHEVAGMPIGVGLALVFSERVADLIAVCILALGGLSIFGAGLWVLLPALSAVVIGTAIASSRWFHEMALRMLGRHRWTRRHMDALTAISETMKSSLAARSLAWSVPVSVAAWGLEGLGLWVLLRSFGTELLGAWVAVAEYAVATLIGAFTFLPAGIGITEASLTGVLVASEVAPAVASAATLTIRVATLWWSVLLGWLALATRPSVLRGLARSDESA